MPKRYVYHKLKFYVSLNTLHILIMMRERVNSGHKSPSQSSSMGGGGIGGNSPANEREDVDDNMDGPGAGLLRSASSGGVSSNGGQSRYLITLMH